MLVSVSDDIKDTEVVDDGWDGRMKGGGMLYYIKRLTR
jgi:hypothetical protein